MSPLIEDITGNALTYKIIGAAMNVHNTLGCGYKEEVYEKALFVELQKCNLSAERQYPVSVNYENEIAATFYLDLYVENLVVVEVKAFSHQLTKDELAQVLGYLKAVGSPVGLLFNFGRRRLEFKRIFPAKNTNPIHRLGRDNAIKPTSEMK